MKYKITLNGCDSSTEFEMELISEEKKLIETMVEKSKKASTFGCQPTMEIEEKK